MHDKQPTILITGAAGFIGFHLCAKLQRSGYKILAIDSLNDYYSPSLKLRRLKYLGLNVAENQLNLQNFKIESDNIIFHRLDIANAEQIISLFRNQRIHIVVNLAAQAGVRYSLERPQAYVQSNMVGFANLLEACRRAEIRHLIYASSSSVYGNSARMPLSIHDKTDFPVSLYAASKKSNELMAYSYAKLFGLPATGLRFFTVYGPWGRPDMAYYSFAESILDGRPIKIYNNGNLQRDFTYIDDIVSGLTKVIEGPIPQSCNILSDSNGTEESVPHRIYNIGNDNPVQLLEFVETLENALDKHAIKQMLPMQPGDVYGTWADITELRKDYGFSPSTKLATGLKEFAKWIQEYRAANDSNELA